MRIAQALVAAFLLSACVQSQAQNACRKLYLQDDLADAERPYSLLAFVGGPRPGTAAATDAEARMDAIRGLERQGTSKLQGYWRKMAEQLGNAERVQLIACDVAVSPAGVVASDLREWEPRKVIGALWSTRESGSPAVALVSLPHFKYAIGKEGASTAPEVVWKQKALPAPDVEGLTAELLGESITQQTMLALNIGLVSIELKQWKVAKRSLCQVLSNLRALETLRPDRTELETDLRALVTDRIRTVNDRAKAANVDLAASDRIKAACAAAGVQ